MTTQNKKESIKNRVNELLNDSFIDAQKLVLKGINSGAIDIENWTPEFDSWLLPKIIATAILEKCAETCSPNGTGHEKTVTKEVKNLKLFL